MADYYYKEETTGNGASPLKIALLGAIAGAVGTGVAMALSNPKNRQKIQQTMKDGQQWMNKTMDDVSTNASKMSDAASDTARKLGKQADQRVDDIRQATEKRAPMR